MKPSRRLPALLTILAALAGLVVFDEPSNGAHSSRVVDARSFRKEGTERAPRPEVGSATDMAESSPLLALRDRRGSEAAPVAGFETRDWTPPPPPPPPVSSLPPPPPQAPALPFAYLGKQWESGKWTVFLAQQERTYIATEGVTIESNYRIEKIEPPVLTVTYLPLQQPQTLAIGPAE